MPYVRPQGFLTDAQIERIYKSIHRTHVTASRTTFTLVHTINPLPVDKAAGPYDVPGTSIQTVEYELHAMVGVKKERRELTSFGEQIDFDLKLYAWLEEMEGHGLGTTPGELDALTKDYIRFAEQEYDIVLCQPAMQFFGSAWSPGSGPLKSWDRNFLAAKFLCVRRERR
jgi:hypothetical protein